MALTPKRRQFVAAYIGEAKGNASEAARIAGYAKPGQEGHFLLKIPEIAQAIEAHLAEVKRQGIASKQNRVDELVERHNALKQIAAERAASEWLTDIPGGSTGFVTKQLKRVKHVFVPDPDDEEGRASVEVEDLWESSVDTGLLKEMREHEKQVAQELGEWTEKSEQVIVGDGERPVLIRLVRQSGDG